MSEWIVRVLPLPMEDGWRAAPGEAGAPATTVLARFRIHIPAPTNRPAGVMHGPRQVAIDVGPVRILAIDTVNPYGGVGGSLDSDQGAWLIRCLDQADGRIVIIVTHHGPRTLTSVSGPEGAAPRILGPEVASILLAHDAVIAWICNTTHERGGRRHGVGQHGFWELPGATTGMGAPLAGGLAVCRTEEDGCRGLLLRRALAGESGPQWRLDGRSFTIRSPVRHLPSALDAPDGHRAPQSSALR